MSKKPLVPTGTAVILTRRIGKELLLLMGKRKGAHGAGEWSLPGGRLEPGETGEERAAIELEEETGILVPTPMIVPFSPVPYSIATPGGEPWVTLFFLSPTVGDVEAENREPDKCEGWTWWHWRSPPSPLFGACGILFEEKNQRELERFDRELRFKLAGI